MPGQRLGHLGQGRGRGRAGQGTSSSPPETDPSTARPYWGDSVLELSPNATQLLHNWTPRTSELTARTPTSAAPRRRCWPGRPRRPGRQERPALAAEPEGARRLEAAPRARSSGGELPADRHPDPTAVFTHPAVWTNPRARPTCSSQSAGTAAYVLGCDRRLRVAWTAEPPAPAPSRGRPPVRLQPEGGGGVVVRRPTSEKPLATLPTGTAATGTARSSSAVASSSPGNANDHASTGASTSTTSPVADP